MGVITLLKGLAETAVARVLRPNKGFPCNASLILVYRSAPNHPLGVEKILEFIFIKTANRPKKMTKSIHSKCKFVTKTMCSHKADIKNSDNTPHITLGTWGLGIDLVGGTWQALPRVRCFPAPAMKTEKIVFQNRKKILPPSEKLNKGFPCNASFVWM